MPSAASMREMGTRSGARIEFPEARIDRAGGPVNVEITFGHAHHATYTIQLFDPEGKTILAKETGVNTDTNPDRFILRLTPAQLDQHLLQWTGSINAFSGGPGQRYSLLFDVIQDGAVVPGGRQEDSGPLDATKAFAGCLMLVAS